MALRVANVFSCHIHISCAGTVNAIASCHKQNTSDFQFVWTLQATGMHFCGSVITHYDTFILRLQSAVGSPRGYGVCGFCGSLCHGLHVVPTSQFRGMDIVCFHNGIVQSSTVHRQGDSLDLPTCPSLNLRIFRRGRGVRNGVLLSPNPLPCLPSTGAWHAPVTAPKAE
ncbi:hypothetical protein SDC9_163831 [bioreactor metagenome]|uniref:Uncharacterized protein n=1 Tax=bioreactor metagenome TaxID=1076179 RepID=A0A645FPY2_9ZZZZ